MRGDGAGAHPLHPRLRTATSAPNGLADHGSRFLAMSLPLASPATHRVGGIAVRRMGSRITSITISQKYGFRAP